MVPLYAPRKVRALVAFSSGGSVISRVGHAKVTWVTRGTPHPPAWRKNEKITPGYKPASTRFRVSHVAKARVSKARWRQQTAITITTGSHLVNNIFATTPIMVS